MRLSLLFGRENNRRITREILTLFNQIYFVVSIIFIRTTRLNALIIFNYTTRFFNTYLTLKFHSSNYFYTRKYDYDNIF